jgi:hypothetical protein
MTPPTPEAARNPLQRPWWFAALALLQLLLAPVLALHPGDQSHLWLLAAVVALALSVDNAVIACGRRLEHAGWFVALGQTRYLLHTVITPLLLPLTVEIGIAGGARLGDSAVLVSWLLCGTWILVGWWVGYRHIALKLINEGQVLFHKNTNRNGRPWLDLLYFVLVIVILVIAGMSTSASIRAALLTGGISMIVCQCLAERWGRSLSNLGELVLLASFFKALTQIHP